MTHKLLMTAVTLGLAVVLFAPAPGDAAVPRTVLVEETGWNS